MRARLTRRSPRTASAASLKNASGRDDSTRRCTSHIREGRAGMELNDILTIAIKGNASDIHLKAGLPPLFRVDGALVPLKNGERLTPEQLHTIATSIMTPGQKTHFDKFHEVDLAYSIAGLGRFRVNTFMQRGTVGIVFRVIPFGVKTIEQLVLPKVVERVAMEAARPDPRHRHDRLGQVDHARRDDRLHQHQPHLPHHHDRGPDRVPDPRQALDREPARDRRRHQQLRDRPARRPAPGPGRHPGR